MGADDAADGRRSGRRAPALAAAAVLAVAALAVAALALAGPARCSAGGWAGSPGVPDGASPADGPGAAEGVGEAPGPAGAGGPAAPDGAPDAAVAARVSVPGICAGKGELAETLESSTGSRATWLVGAGLEEAAASVIEGYRARAGLSLEHDGYLDLLGQVWSCVVVSEEGWSEVALVDAREGSGGLGGEGAGEGSCRVTVARIAGARTAAAGVGGQDGQGGGAG